MTVDSVEETRAAPLPFTAGPWHPGHLGSDSTCQCTSVVSEGYAGGICRVVVGNDLPIGEGGNDGPPRDEAIGNMHLIAAAPDLFAVAVECLELAKLAATLTGCRGDDDYVWGIQERLEAVIAQVVRPA